MTARERYDHRLAAHTLLVELSALTPAQIQAVEDHRPPVGDQWTAESNAWKDAKTHSRVSDCYAAWSTADSAIKSSIRAARERAILAVITKDLISEADYAVLMGFVEAARAVSVDGVQLACLLERKLSNFIDKKKIQP